LTIYLIVGCRARGGGDRRPPAAFREALAIRHWPRRRMGCFMIVYMVIAQLAHMCSAWPDCPLYLVGLLLVGGVSSLTDGRRG